MHFAEAPSEHNFLYPQIINLNKNTKLQSIIKAIYGRRQMSATNPAFHAWPIFY
jgi:hypothetical protein